jgi:alginate O-acetyltransferase complex protein AlgJ
MNSAPDQPTRRQAWTDWLVILIFVGMLWLPTLDKFFHLDWSEPADENRLMASKPVLNQWSVSGLQAYLAATENYFNDHFGFRRRLVRWCQQWKQRLYQNKSVNLVIPGQRGWYYICERQMIDHYLGLAKFTPEQLQAWQRLLEKRRDWLAARGIKYLFVIPPDKQDIYPENLPAWLITSRPANAQTKLDQFVEYMKAHSTVQIVDLRPALVAGKQTAPPYLQNDTHWNLYGGFLAAQQIIQALSPVVPDLPQLHLEDFVWTNAPVNGGDLTSVLEMHPAEKNSYVFTPKPPLIAPDTWVLTNIVRNWNPRDKAKVNRLVLNRNPVDKPVDLVIFNDSFARAWWQFFGYSFHRSVFIWEDKEFNTRIINDNHPQVVINEMLERIFNTEDPNEMMAMEALP